MIYYSLTRYARINNIIHNNAKYIYLNVLINIMECVFMNYDRFMSQSSNCKNSEYEKNSCITNILQKWNDKLVLDICIDNEY